MSIKINMIFFIKMSKRREHSKITLSLHRCRPLTNKRTWSREEQLKATDVLYSTTKVEEDTVSNSI